MQLKTVRSQQSRFIGAGCACALLLLSVCGCEAKKPSVLRKPVVKVAIQPAYSVHLMTRRYKGLMDYLQEQTGYRVEWVSSATYESFPAAVEGAKADVCFVSPLLYVIFAKTKGAFPLVKAVMPSGNGQSRGLIIAHDSTASVAISDLMGATVVVPSKVSLTGYIAQLALCQREGINPSQLTFVVAKRHDEAVVRVSRGAARFGFVREEALQEAAERVDLSKVRIVAVTDPFPTWCFVAFPETKPEVWEQIKKALLELDIKNPKHKRILQDAGLGGFVETTDAEYNSVRQILLQLKMPY